MKTLTQLRIDHFRGIRDLNIEHLTSINVMRIKFSRTLLVLVHSFFQPPIFHRIHAASALALTRSIACRMPAHTDRSVNTSTMLP